jgi:integrase
MRGQRLLTTKEIEKAKPKEKVYRLRDGGGLFLLVRPDGGKYFQHRYTFGGSEKLAQIGPFPTMTLEAARIELEVQRRVLLAGKDPITERRVAKAKGVEAAAATFDAVFWEWMRHPRSRPWSANHVERNEGLYRRLLKPRLAALPVADVTAAPFREIVKGCEKDGILESGRRALGIAAQVLDYAIAHEMAENNPARAVLRLLDKPDVKHFEALRRDDIGPLLVKMDEDKTLDLITKAGLYLSLVTSLRDNSLRGAKWKEFDIGAASWETAESGVWEIPAERMKGREPHRVPLPRQAMAVLRMLRQMTYSGPESYVFASSRAKSGYMAENTLRLALHRLGFKVTVHGMRSLMTDVLNEAEFPPDWVERQLAHVEKNKVRASYLRTDFLDQRIGMIQWFADYCDARKAGKSHEEAAGQTGNVLQLRGGKAA